MNEIKESPVHWLRGGSNSPRIAKCPGSVQMKIQYPDSGPSNPAAIDGTHTHTLVEVCLRNGFQDPGDYIGKELSDHEGNFIVKEDRADRARIMVDYCRDRVIELGHLGFTPLIYVEEFVDLGKFYDVEEWGGSLDCAITWENGIEVIDYKDGGRQVGPDTEQLVTYGGGMAGRVGKGVETIITTVVQPKVWSEAKSRTHSVEEFGKRVADLAVPMKESMDPNARRVAGGHCTFCPGAKAGRCPEYNQRGHRALVQAPSVSAALPTQIPKIGPDTPEEILLALIDGEAVVSALIKEAKEEALRRIKQGGQVAGYRAGESTTQQKLKLEAQQEFTKLKLPKSLYLKEAKKTPRQIITSAAFKKLPKKKQAAILNLIEKPPGSPILVPVSSKAPAISVDLNAAFADVPDAPKQ